ncbi:Uncharacterised protein [Bordetella pertussis]|nr:Uncharacterised protein [Bordetella pertussis]
MNAAPAPRRWRAMLRMGVMPMPPAISTCSAASAASAKALTGASASIRSPGASRCIQADPAAGSRHCTAIS